MQVPVFEWRVIPLRSSGIRRRCQDCAAGREFESTRKFRVNANGRRIDVWLLYRCRACGGGWKRSILRRSTPEQIGPGLLRRFLDNDPELARRYADEEHGSVALDVRVERPSLDATSRAILELRVRVPCGVRLDRLLARELGVSRSAVARAHRCGAIRLEPDGPRRLRRPPRDGQRVELRPDLPGWCRASASQRSATILS